MDWLGWITNGWRPGSLAWRLRQARWKVFLGLIEHLPRPVRVLDLGGAEPFWAAMGREYGEDDFEVTMVNLYPQRASLSYVRAVTGSVLDLSGLRFGDYDVVFSNSVIEHLGAWENQVRMADEVRALGLPYCVQTPNRYFPIEPHFLFPVFQFLPRSQRVWLASRWRYGSYCRPGDVHAAAATVDEIRLLTGAEMQRLFPEAKLYRERIGPLVKSYVAVGGGAGGCNV